MKKFWFMCCFLLIFSFINQPDTPTFIDGIKIQGQNVSGLTDEQAREILEPLIKKIQAQKIILVAPDKEKIWVTNYKAIGITPDVEKALSEGLALGNKGIIFKRWMEKLKAKGEEINLPLVLTMDKIVASYEIQRLTKSLVQSPQDAQLIVHFNNKIEIKPDVSGIAIDTIAMLKNLENALSLQGPISIQVLTKEVKANISEKDLKDLKIKTLLGQYTTRFNPQKKNRTSNIKQAAQALDNFILEPGKEFSFNKVVGPRTKEAGYNEAPIILNNRFTQGVGGGVCQVSTTMYNVLLKANLNITERHPHSLPIRYVPKGLDAAVVYGYKDLKFINNTSGHLLIKSYVGQGNITIKIFGHKDKELNIELRSFVEKIIPPKVVVKTKQNEVIEKTIVEQEGVEGYVVRVERIIRDNNQNVLIHEILTRDYYPPVDKIIIVNNGN